MVVGFGPFELGLGETGIVGDVDGLGRGQQAPSGTAVIMIPDVLEFNLRLIIYKPFRST